MQQIVRTVGTLQLFYRVRVFQVFIRKMTSHTIFGGIYFK